MSWTIKTTRSAGALLLVIMAGPTHPQADRVPRPDEAMLFQDVPTVFSASKFEQTTDAAPAAVSIVTGEAIRNYGYRTLADILNSVRGFTITSDRNYSYVGVRGFSRTGDYNSRVLLLIDGRRINDNLYDNIALDQEGLIDPALIERIEVVRGPGSSLYGRSAFFAVVNVITIRGRDLNGIEAAVGVGSLGTNAAGLSYGKRFETGLEAVFSASGYGSRGETRLFFDEFNSPATNFGVAENADGEHAKRVFTKLRYGPFTLEAAGSDRTKNIPTAPFGTEFNDNRTKTRDQRSYIELRYEEAVSPTTEIEARLAYNTSDYRGDYAYAYRRGTLVNKDFAVGRWWTGEFLLTSRMQKSHTLSFGGEYQIDERMDQGNYDRVTYLDDRRRGRIAGIYAQDEWRLAPHAILNAGIRYDQFSTFGSTVNPRLALVLFPASSTVLKLLSGAAYRAPNVYELYYNDGNITQRANPDLRPEKIETYQAVVEQRLAGGWRLSGSLFRNRIRNLITQISEPATGLLVFTNLENVRSHGASVELQHQAPSGAEIRVSISSQANTDAATGLSIPASPRTTGKLNILVPIGRRTTAGIATRYQSAVQSLTGLQIDGRFITDLTIRCTAPDLRTAYTLSLFNLFNRVYADPVGAEFVQDRIAQPGRTLWMHLRHSF